MQSKQLIKKRHPNKHTHTFTCTGWDRWKPIQLSDSKLCDKLNDWIICKVDEQTNTESKAKTTVISPIKRVPKKRGPDESTSEIKRTVKLCSLNCEWVKIKRQHKSRKATSKWICVSKLIKCLLNRVSKWQIHRKINRHSNLKGQIEKWIVRANNEKKMAKITIFRNLNQMRQKYDKQTCKTQATN